MGPRTLEIVVAAMLLVACVQAQCPTCDYTNGGQAVCSAETTSGALQSFISLCELDLYNCQNNYVVYQPQYYGECAATSSAFQQSCVGCYQYNPTGYSQPANYYPSGTNTGVNYYPSGTNTGTNYPAGYNNYYPSGTNQATNYYPSGTNQATNYYPSPYNQANSAAYQPSGTYNQYDQRRSGSDINGDWVGRVLSTVARTSFRSGAGSALQPAQKTGGTLATAASLPPRVVGTNVVSKGSAPVPARSVYRAGAALEFAQRNGVGGGFAAKLGQAAAGARPVSPTNGVPAGIGGRVLVGNTLPVAPPASGVVAGQGGGYRSASTWAGVGGQRAIVQPVVGGFVRPVGSSFPPLAGSGVRTVGSGYPAVQSGVRPVGSSYPPLAGSGVRTVGSSYPPVMGGSLGANLARQPALKG